MARESAGSIPTFLCSDGNGEFTVTGESQNPLYELVNQENDQDKSSLFGSRCIDDAADKKIKETPKQSKKQAEVAVTLLKLRPLGLKLSVTPSLLDLASSPKLKAVNFSAEVLKIGNWKIESRYEGHLVAKCYYVRKMLLWEILERGLKNKIQIQWNNIIAMRAIIQENQPGFLELELNRPPELYVEKDPQPKKHCKWKPVNDFADDFTGGQASTYRRHYLQFPPGSFDKHFETLLQCDKRLYQLCHQPFPSLQSPYFDPIIFSSDFSFDSNGDHRPECDKRLYQLCHQPFPSLQSPYFDPIIFSSDFSFDSNGDHRPDSNLIPSPSVATQTHFQETLSPISVMDFWHSDKHSNNSPFDGPEMGLSGGQSAAAAAAETLSFPTIQFCPQVMNPAISYQNYANPSNYGQTDNLLTSIEDHLFSDKQVEGCYDGQYHMARIASLNELVSLPKQLQQEENLASENGSQKAFYGQEMGINEQFQVYQQQQHHQVSWDNTYVVNDPGMENFGTNQYQQSYQ